jgi:hypothetical protein
VRSEREGAPEREKKNRRRKGGETEKRVRQSERLREGCVCFEEKGIHMANMHWSICQ